MSTLCWHPRDRVVMRHVRGAWIWAVAAHVVEDRGDFVALYVQPGNGMSRMGDADGTLTRDFVNASTSVPGVWVEHHCLILVREGDRHATELFWSEHEWELRCWYINFQEPIRRFALGFESMDQTLDLVIVPDLCTWFWKDEDEFDHGILDGWYTPELLVQLKAHGARIVEDAGARRPPFDHPWDAWRPNPEWPPIPLPTGWDA